MMKWKVAGVLMCVLSLLGCSNDVEKPTSQRRVTVDTPRGKLMIQDPIQDLDEKYVTASVVGDGFEATLRVTSTGNDVGTKGGLVELLDPSGELLYSIETSVNTTTGEVVYTQSTPDDYLTFSIAADGERVRERYDANGDIAVFEYPALSDDAQRRAINYYEHGLPATNLPGDVAEYVTQAGAFQAYYLPHATSSVHNNPAGETLVQILSSPELPGLVTGDDPDPERAGWMDSFCHWASACSAFACRIGPTSVVCEFCVTASLACIIVEFVCIWFGC